MSRKLNKFWDNLITFFSAPFCRVPFRSNSFTSSIPFILLSPSTSVPNMLNFYQAFYYQLFRLFDTILIILIIYLNLTDRYFASILFLTLLCPHISSYEEIDHFSRVIWTHFVCLPFNLCNVFLIILLHFWSLSYKVKYSNKLDI